MVRNGKYIKCKICKKQFYIPRNRFGTAKYCSSLCRGNSARKRFYGICEVCGDSFDYIACREGKAKYCSRRCYYKAMNKKGTISMECAECGDIFFTSPSRKRRGRKFCSTECVYKNRKKTPWGNFIHVRKSMKRRGLISQCERCKYNKEPSILGIHHKDCNKKNNAPENLIVLCPNCHSLEHRYHVPH